MHVAPGAFGLASAVVKHTAVRLTASCVSRSHALIGARAVLRDGPGAVLDKAVRDNAMVAVIDTSVLGNLRALAMHLPAYAPAFADDPAATTEPDGPAGERLRAVFALGEATGWPHWTPPHWTWAYGPRTTCCSASPRTPGRSAGS